VKSKKAKYERLIVFKQAKNVLLAFTNKKTLQFPEIDVRFLLNYETYLRKRELKDTTLIFYIKTLRILYNRALSQRLFKVDNSAFNDFKISKFDKTTQHRALSEDDINSLKFLPIDDTSSLFLARNIFLFSFYTMGMSLIDVANLTWSNVLQDTNNGVVSYRIIYERSKTSKKINLKLTDKALEILDYYKGMKTDNYLFPILNSETDTPQKIYNRIRKQTVSINKDLKKLAKLCNIKMNLTTYVARHSCATTLKRKGVTTSIISEMLGHKNEMITQIYLDSFGNDVTDKAMDLL
jgi:site-specific recombinase XerD